ncbi:MAG: MerR family transcriptional regulator [Christensenellales bacterium]|jgi:DNA-binding transcriptional MerR regulator
MFYKIGEFSRYSGVSIDTLRHYERCGILCPQIDSTNGYRLYTDGDFITLMNIRQQRGMDITLPEIAEYQQGHSLNEQLTRYDEQIRQLDEKIQHLQLLKQRCIARQNSIRSVKSNLGKIVQVNCRPAYHLFFHTLESLPSEQARVLVEKWVQSMPFAGYFVSVTPNDLTNGPLNLQLGLSADLRYVGEFSLPIHSPVKAMMGGPGFQYTMAVEDLFSLTLEDLRPALDYAAQRNCVVSDDVCFAIDAIEYRPGLPPLYYVQMRFPVRAAGV